MSERLKRIGLQALGWMFLILGIAGMVLPVLQGILFLLIGLYILSHQYDWAHRWVERLHRRHPAVFARTEYWLARFGLKARPRAEVEQTPAPQVLSLKTRVAALVLLVLLLAGFASIGRLGLARLHRCWGELRASYQVVSVRPESHGYLVEVQRKWSWEDQRYLLRCHFCDPVRVGDSYHFEPIPGEQPPLMKRVAGPGEVPDVYTVVERRTE